MTLIAESAGRTHVGLVRQRNEDALYVGTALFAVADGLGGHVAGDIASGIVIEALRPYDGTVGPLELPTVLGRVVSSANDAVRGRVAEEPELATMGSTLVALMWSDTSACLANLGDSRAYLLRRTADGAAVMAQVTEDHTFGHLLADAGAVRHLPRRLARWVDGRPGGRSADITAHQLRPGDRWLLCSDGLSSYVAHDAIRETLSSVEVPGDVADRLIELALEAGGRDNITVIVIDFADANS